MGAKRIPQVRLVSLTGDAVKAYLSDLARLRITVFREFPYLYDGNEEYEQRYLETYVRSPGSVVVLAIDGDQVVGASTGVPLIHEPDSVTAPIRAQGLDVEKVFYYGESVLLPGWRGLGLGVAFFQRREDQARRLGRFTHAVFCAVDRPVTHPRRPAGYVPLDEFWHRRGFRPLAGASCSMRWQDLDESSESPKQLNFWIKVLPQRGTA